MRGDTLAKRHESTMARLEQIKRAGYQVKVQWKCEFDDAVLVELKSELLAHPIVRQCTQYIRDALYGCRTEAMRLHYKVREN